MATYNMDRKIVLGGLPGRPQTVAGVKGWDYQQGAMWFADVYPAGDGSSNSAPIPVPDGVEYVKVVPADEYITDEALAAYFDARMGTERE